MNPNQTTGEARPETVLLRTRMGEIWTALCISVESPIDHGLFTNSMTSEIESIYNARIATFSRVKFYRSSFMVIHMNPLDPMTNWLLGYNNDISAFPFRQNCCQDG